MRDSRYQEQALAHKKFTPDFHLPEVH